MKQRNRTRVSISAILPESYMNLKGNIVRLDDGTVLEYLPWKVELDISNTPYEQTAGARMKKYEVDETATKDGKLMENDIVLFRYADVLLMKSEAKIRNGEDGDAELNEVRGRGQRFLPNGYIRKYPCRTTTRTGLGRLATAGSDSLRSVHESIQQSSATSC